jgi:hypothetical protein
LALDQDLDHRAAAEELGYTFLPCVLVGLSRAPDLVPLGPHGPQARGVPDRAIGMTAADSSPEPINPAEGLSGADRWMAGRNWSGVGFQPGALLTATALGAVVAPAGALGGEAVLASAERGIPVIAVQNPCLLQVTGEALGLEVLPAATYAEAAGLVLALREGLDPATLRRTLGALQ